MPGRRGLLPLRKSTGTLGQLESVFFELSAAVGGRFRDEDEVINATNMRIGHLGFGASTGPVIGWEDDEDDSDDSEDDSGKDFPNIVPGSNVCESDWVVGDSGDCNKCGLVISLNNVRLTWDLPGDLMLCEGCFLGYMGLAEPMD